MRRVGNVENMQNKRRVGEINVHNRECLEEEEFCVLNIWRVMCCPSSSCPYRPILHLYSPCVCNDDLYRIYQQALLLLEVAVISRTLDGRSVRSGVYSIVPFLCLGYEILPKTPSNQAALSFRCPPCTPGTTFSPFPFKPTSDDGSCHVVVSPRVLYALSAVSTSSRLIQELWKIRENSS